MLRKQPGTLSPADPLELLDLGRYDLRLLSESEQFEIEQLLMRPTGDPADRARRDLLLAKAEQH
jgi:hypothetical protein